MLELSNPAWWATLAGIVGSAVGVFNTNLTDPTKAVISAVGGLVIVVYTICHHQHLVAQVNAGATVAAAKASATAASAASLAGALNQANALLGATTGSAAGAA